MLNKFLSSILTSILILPAYAAVNDTIVMTAVGDIMLGTSYPSREYLPPNDDCSPLLKEVESYFQQSDIAFANLEGVFTDTLTSVKKCSNPKVCYAFAMPTNFAKCLKSSGINLLSVANNHVGDFGNQGIQTTIRTLRSYGIRYAGLLITPWDTFTVKGVKIGFTAFSPNSRVNDIRQLERAVNIVKTLKQQCDIVIVSFHGGAEGKEYRHVPKQNEFFLGENRGNVHDFAHRMIDAGADVLLGHGPHVTRAVELYKNRFITYSMGNFATYSRINVSGVSGVAPLFILRITNKGEFVDGRIIPTFQTYRSTVKIDPERQAIQEIINLSAQDFPDSPLDITSEGLINVNKT